jgi:hypothetical protein
VIGGKRRKRKSNTSVVRFFVEELNSMAKACHGMQWVMYIMMVA